MRKYAEFFTDFCLQESELISQNALLMTCAILAFTRKHLNCEVIWPVEMELLTFKSFSEFKAVFSTIEMKYSETFPDHALNQ
jgi:hypothetical protein